MTKRSQDGSTEPLSFEPATVDLMHDHTCQVDAEMALITSETIPASIKVGVGAWGTRHSIWRWSKGGFHPQPENGVPFSMPLSEY